jgi:hypothetical protein
MMKREAEGAEVLFGVSLSDVARVHAAERTGVSVDERLGEMGLSRAGFARGEQAWLERLAVSLRDDPGLFVAYDEALSEALAKDGPRLLPYEEELAAWVSFEGHLQRALDPGETARRAGLTLAEVARLHGSWAQRLAADAKLAEEATRLRAEEPGALVEVRREPRARRAVVDRVHSASVAKEMGAAGPAVMGVPPAPVVAAVAAIAPPAILGPAPVGVPGGSAPAPMSTGTGAIDLGALLRGPLPFDPNAGAIRGQRGGGWRREWAGTSCNTGVHGDGGSGPIAIARGAGAVRVGSGAAWAGWCAAWIGWGAARGGDALSAASFERFELVHGHRGGRRSGDPGCPWADAVPEGGVSHRYRSAGGSCATPGGSGSGAVTAGRTAGQATSVRLGDHRRGSGVDRRRARQGGAAVPEVGKL